MCMVLHLSLQTSSNDGRIELESNNAGVTVGVIILRLKWDAMCERATTRNFFLHTIVSFSFCVDGFKLMGFERFSNLCHQETKLYMNLAREWCYKVELGQ